MELRRIGSLEVSVIGLGCNNFNRAVDEQQSIDIVHAALDAGINHFDTADAYNAGKSEEFLGEAVAGHREEVVICSKFGRVQGRADGRTIDARPEHVREAAEASLRRLGTDYIDLYLLHIPDPLTPIEDTLGAMNQLVDEGKVREIGCSQVDVAFLQEAADVAEKNALRPFINVQNRYNILDHEQEDQLGVREFCVANGMTFIPFSPLASGLLSGKYHRGETPASGTRLAGSSTPGYKLEDLLSDRAFDLVEKLTTFAEGKGHTLLELAFAGLLARPEFPSIIAGATSPAQIEANVRGAAWRLTPEEFEELKALSGTSN